VIADILGIGSTIEEYIIEIAKAKVEDINTRQETSADLFFSALESVAGEGRFPYYNKADDKAYIHLVDAMKMVKDNGYGLPQQNDLIHDLKSHPAFIKNKHTHRFKWVLEGTEQSTNPKSAWVFDLSKI
jgi:hypothetical protein